MLVTSAETERIHLSTKKNSLTYQFKTSVTHNGIERFLSSLLNLSNKTEKLKVDVRYINQ